MNTKACPTVTAQDTPAFYKRNGCKDELVGPSKATFSSYSSAVS